MNGLFHSAESQLKPMSLYIFFFLYILLDFDKAARPPRWYISSGGARENYSIASYATLMKARLVQLALTDVHSACLQRQCKLADSSRCVIVVTRGIQRAKNLTVVSQRSTSCCAYVNIHLGCVPTLQLPVGLASCGCVLELLVQRRRRLTLQTFLPKKSQTTWLSCRRQPWAEWPPSPSRSCPSSCFV